VIVGPIVGLVVVLLVLTCAILCGAQEQFRHQCNHVKEPLTAYLKSGVRLANNRADLNVPFQIASTWNEATIQNWIRMDKSNWDLIRWKLQNAEIQNGTPNHCIDAGCNHGFYSFFMASFGCHTDCYEIQPELAAVAFKGTEANNMTHSVRVHLAGLSDKQTTMTFSGKDGTAFLTAEKGAPGSFDVPVYPASDCEYSHHYSVVKIDVEGFEIKTLAGMIPIIDKGIVDSLLVEIGPDRWERAGLNFADGYAILKRALQTYDCYVIIRNELDCANHIYPKESPGDLKLTGNQVLRRIPWTEAEAVFKHLGDGHDNCNFWFIRGDMSELTKAHPMSVYEYTPN
jgi:FkbM family methyltransferase